MIAKFYKITLDELLETDEIIAIVKNENKENISRFASYIDAIFNIKTIIGLFLPLYKIEINKCILFNSFVSI